MIRMAPPRLTAEQAVISVLAASPRNEIRGKKRFHKVTFLCAFCDAPIDARFSIRHFGVFSGEIADALDILTTFGDLETRDEQIGPNGYFTTVYSLASEPDYSPDPVVKRVVETVKDYSTPSLEVASTVAYFLTQGLSEGDAAKETKRIKPDIATAGQLAKTRALLKELAESTATHGQRPKNP